MCKKKKKKRQGKLPYVGAGLIFGQTEVSLICGSAWGISKEKKALSDAELELPDVSEMNESRVYRLRAFSHSHINRGLSSSHQDNHMVECFKEPTVQLSVWLNHIPICDEMQLSSCLPAFSALL